MRISDWSSDVCSSDLRAGGLLSAGFLGRQPTHHEVMDGVDAPAAIAAGAPALVFWTGSWGVLKGDRQILTIIGPDGSVFMSAERVLERNRATESRWIGRTRRSEPWPPGRSPGLNRPEPP